MEKKADRSVRVNTEGIGEKMLAFIISKGWYDDSPEVKEALAGGFEAFRKKVAERIFTEHKTEINLNCCPNCGKIARTPMAKQCRFCLFDWH